MAAPPGPSRKFREFMFAGVVHKTGTPRGTCFFFCFASTADSGNDNSKIVKAINLLQIVVFGILKYLSRNVCYESTSA